eukprot:58885-Pyramimonas_sp.AAC.1
MNTPWPRFPSGVSSRPPGCAGLSQPLRAPRSTMSVGLALRGLKRSGNHRALLARVLLIPANLKKECDGKTC